MSKETIKVGRQYRSATIVRESVNVTDRTMELAFSSETPVERWFGKEILGHGPGECNLDWLSSGRAPFLVDHNTREQIGVVVRAWIGADLKGRALVRFGSSVRAEQELQDCAAGIRCNVSVGYDLDELVLVESGGEPGDPGADPTYRAKWTPWEISTVAIPADTAVGVGREAAEGARDIPVVKPSSNRTRSMEPNTQNQPAPAPAPAPVVTPGADTAAILRAERQRVEDITALGTRHQLKEITDKAIKDGTSIEAFRGIVLMSIEPGKPLETPATELGMSRKEAKSYSVVRMLAAQANAKTGAGDLRSLAPFEAECHTEVEKRLGVAARGIFVPLDVQRQEIIVAPGQRDLVVGTANAGGNLVATDLRPADFITLLRNAMMVRAMGATVLTGLVGNIAIPKQTGAGTAYWVGENAAPTESQQTVGQVPLSPKSVAAFTDYSRLLLKQSSIDIEGFVRSDLSQILGLAIDLASLHGSGAANQPLGLAGTAGIGAVVGGTNGAAPTWGNIVDLETQVAVANADVGRMGYLTNAKVRGKLKQTEKAATTAQFVWPDVAGPRPGFGLMNGYGVGVTNQVASNLTKGTSNGVCSALFFGNWADLLIGEWGVLDLLVNPYIGADAGTVRVHAFQSVDIAVRRAGSFSAMQDALTA